ncbi:GerAB/ArcD/ProY family transporter [Cohnella phaseoli]|uniref:Spore germination protein KB n=1 Tax=Cohnella phaseoli TaxID=456490 RepID=A0A3D9IP08_9BACL|nr:endospore germination permease [Cohnella phaseoli]RED63465.1 spore germination protein KB [Cohnella phaseoli]
MIRKEKISVRQFCLIVAIFAIGTPILVIPAELAAIAKQDAWIVPLIGTVISLPFIGLYVAVGRLAPDKTLVEKLEWLLSKWIGKAVILAFAFFCFVNSSELLYYIGNFMSTQSMPNTPLLSLNILFALIIVMGIRLGIETLARTAELMFVLFIVLFIILVVFVSPQIEFDRIQPVLETKMNSLTWATLYFISVLSFPSFVLLMIFPSCVDRPKEASKAFYKGTIIGGVVIVTIIALCILVLGVEITSIQTFPSYALAKKINVGHFLQRIEIVMAIMWFISIFYRLTFYFYGAVESLAQVFGLKNSKSIVFPLGLLMVAMSLVVHPNMQHDIEYTHAWMPYGATFGLLLPLLLLGVYAVRKKKL